jgi:hypothetical protein
VPQGETERRFRQALSAVIAKHMVRCGMAVVYDLITRAPDRTLAPAQSVYSAAYGRGRISVFTMMQVAGALGVTVDRLIDEAQEVMAKGKIPPGVWEVYGSASPAGRGRKKHTLTDGDRRKLAAEAKRRLRGK